MTALSAEVFKDFSESVKGALAKFNAQEQEIASLKQHIGDLESKLAATPEANLIKGFGFTNASEAKTFVDVCRSIFLKDDASLKDMTEGVDSEGGFLVPLEVRNTLLMMLNTYGVARPRCTVIPVARDELMMPRLVDGVQVFWIGEGQAITQTQPTFDEFRMVVKKLAALVPITSELLSDSVIPIANLLATLFANAIAKEEDRVIFRGSVVGGDPFNGVLYDPNVTNFVMPAGATGFGSLTADMLADVTSSLIPAASDGAAFFMHRTVLNVIRKLKYSGNGEYIYEQMDGAPGTPGTLWGYPVVLAENMPTINDSAANKPFMFFGNMKHYYIGDRMNLSVARSEHYGFANDKVFLRVIQRESLAAAFPDAFIAIKTAAA